MAGVKRGCGESLQCDTHNKKYYKTLEGLLFIMAESAVSDSAGTGRTNIILNQPNKVVKSISVLYKSTL